MVAGDDDEDEGEVAAASDEAADAKEAITAFEGHSWLARPAAAGVVVSLLLREG